MQIDTNQIAEECIKTIRDKIQNLTRLNIIVAGKTGVGKSTLINSVFREKMAETGIGRPITPHMRQIKKEGFPLTIYDTRGFELGKEAQVEVRDKIIDTIHKGYASKEIDDMVHCIWYCVNMASNRLEEEEIEWIKSLAEQNKDYQVPIIIVLTQCFSKKKAQEMRNFILDENLDVVQVVPVLADDYVAKAFGLDVLINVMTQALPGELLDTLHNIQIVNNEAKKRHAQAAVVAATAAAFGEGFAPIPFADCAALIPTQVAMIASITAIYGFDVNKSFLTAFTSSVLGTAGATIAGKTLVSNIMKFIPGAGTILGGTISGATAGLLTTALGETYIIMEAILAGEMKMNDLETKEGKEKVIGIFKNKVASGNVATA